MEQHSKTRQYKYIKEPTLNNLIQLRQNLSADAATTKQLNMIHLRSKHVGWKDHCFHDQVANPSRINILGLPWQQQRKNKRDKQHKPRCNRSQFVGLSSSRRRRVTVKEQERSSLKMSRRNCRDINERLDQHQDLYDDWSSSLRQKKSLGHYETENRRQPSRQQPHSLVVRVRK